MPRTETSHFGRPKLNVLLTEDRTYPDEHWTVQVSRLLEPMGVSAYLARTGQEAVTLAAELEFHVAVIDLSTPKATPGPGSGSRGSHAHPRTPVYGPDLSVEGMWILEQLRRLPRRPPVVVVDRPALNRQEAERVLRDVLRLGAFSVLHKPIHVEQLLSVLQRLLDRRYEGYWPTWRQEG